MENVLCYRVNFRGCNWPNIEQIIYLSCPTGCVGRVVNVYTLLSDDPSLNHPAETKNNFLPIC